MSNSSESVDGPDIARGELVDVESSGAVVPDAILSEDSAVERREAGDEPARDRLKEIYDTSIKELGTSVSPDLRDELERVTIPFGGQHPTDAELRVAQAQLVGWLEGLFHGIQATLFAQQMAARSQMEDPRRQIGPGQPGQAQGAPSDERPGTYL